MAYLALARKYRPQRFADMIGQEHVTRTLENAIRSDRVHHAYLFCGVRGLGKTTAARILAKALVCEKGPTPEPCNACSQCVGINEGRSVDVIEIDGASNNSVDDIRSLRDQVNYLPQSARRKIYIIDEVHMLTQAAFNALLKTLEEPPPHVTFMFATTDPHKVLATILSRVSRLDYRRVRAATLVPYLGHILEQEGFAVEAEGLHVIARCGEGSVRDSLTLLDKVIAFASEPTNIKTAEVLEVLGHAGQFAVAELVDAVLERDAKLVLARFEALTSTGSDLMRLAVAILQHLRDLAVVKLTGGSRDALLDMSDDMFEQILAQSQRVDATVISQHFDRFARVVDSLENSRVPRLVVEMGLLELCNAEPLLPLGDLVARLDALAAGGSRGGGGGGGGGRAPSRGRQAQSQARTQPGMRAEPGIAESKPPARFEARVQPAPSSARDSTHSPARRAELRPANTPARLERQQPVIEPRAAVADRPPAQPAPARGRRGPEDDHVDRLEQLARDAGLLPGGPSSSPSASAQPKPASEYGHSPAPQAKPSGPPQSNPRPESPAQAGPQPSDQPPDPSAAFTLQAGALAPAERPEQRDAGCPSSRCTPREAIAWRELDKWDAWETFIDRVREENQLLAGVLSSVGLVNLRGGTVEIAAPSTGLAQTQLRENPELKTAFEQFTAVYFGEVMHLSMLDVTPSLPHTPSLELVDHERARLHRERIEREADQNPKLRALLSTFAGQVAAIEPLGGPALPPVGERGLPTQAG